MTVFQVKVAKNTYSVLGLFRISSGVGLNVGERDCWGVITNSWLELLISFFRDVVPDFSIVMKTITFHFISHVLYGFVN